MKHLRQMTRIPLITGPTAVGKTGVAIALAKRLDAEIISADSRQIYRDLSVGTAKPDVLEMDGVPHHFIDELGLPDIVSAGWFERQANRRIQEIRDRGRNVVVVGGSTLYVHALVAGLPDIPDVDRNIVERLNHEVQLGKSAELFRELVSVDPGFAETLDSTKSQRLVRGLSVFRGTGRPISSFFASVAPAFQYEVVVLGMTREALYERINSRARAMIDAGLLEEAAGLLESGFDRSLSPLKTIGYTEAFDFLEGRIVSRETLEHLLMRNTRRYAKRQMTWLRRYGEAAILENTASSSSLVDAIMRRMNS